jgi:glycosyltransferase involved in cell wall biosynthesis
MSGRKNIVCIIAKYAFPFDTRLAQQVSVLRKNRIPSAVICVGLTGQKKVDVLDNCSVYRVLVLADSNKKDGLDYFRVTFAFMVLSFIKLVSLSIKNKVRCIVVHTLPECMIFIGLLHKIAGTKLVLDGRDLSVELIQSRFPFWATSIAHSCFCWIEKISMSLCDTVIIASNGFKRSIVERGIDPKKVVVLLNTADETIFKYDGEREFNSIQENAKIIYHGTVAERFGIHIAIDAMPIVLKNIPKSVLYVYGYYLPSYKKELEKQIQENGLSENVKLLESVSLDKISKVISIMDIGIVPYISTHFMNLALSTKAFEYISSKLPVVASRLKSINELFSEKSITYCIPGNAVDLAEKVVEICKNTELRKKNQERALQEFSTISGSVMAEKYLELIRRYI